MRYSGGKGKCFQHLINMMPPHGTYIESHLGGGAVLRRKIPARHSIGIDKDSKVILEWENRYPGLCELVQADATDYLHHYKYSGNELIYADPPYVKSTRRRARVYSCDYTDSDHEQLLNVLKQSPCMVMLSGYDNEIYNDILVDWRKETFFAKTHVDVRQECVWLNFKPSTRLHDVSHLGTNFRERQTIKRRQNRLRERIQRLAPIERSELMRWISCTYGNLSGESA
ncbi:MAG: DNA adenine methylase [Gallionella sp.]|nr:DNA adenine methylase [Gallionella sp.]